MMARRAAGVFGDDLPKEASAVTGDGDEEADVFFVIPIERDGMEKINTLLTAAEWARLLDVVHAAAGMGRAERTEYLEQVCKGQPSLRTRAESLLDALESENSGFGEAIGGAASRKLEAETAAGSRIGPYRIVGRLGRGGIGGGLRRDPRLRPVPEAGGDQSDGRGAVRAGDPAAFGNERQILANLDHPNIARRLDGGATEAGLPYVVMEFVDGRLIDKYCRERGLNARGSWNCSCGWRGRCSMRTRIWWFTAT